MILVDTHTHLFLSEFDADRSRIVEQAIKEGVKCMFLPNINVQSVQPMLDLSKSFPENCFPMIGLHPTSVKENFKDELKSLSNYFSTQKFIAIGEVGLDLYWDKTYYTQQCEALETQIEWSRNYQLPIVLHTRDAYPEMLDLLVRNAYNSLYSGVFHSFAGNIDQAHQAIEMGFHIGISGVVTFKNSNLSDVVKAISLDKILLETDSPYLTPVPKRGQRNDSSYVRYIAEKIAEIKNVSLQEVAEKTTNSALKLFHKNLH